MGSPRLHLTLLGLSLCALKITVHFIIHPPPPPPSPNLHGSAYFPLKPTVFSWFPLLIIVYRVQKFAYIRIILLKLCYFFRWQVRERENTFFSFYTIFNNFSAFQCKWWWWWWASSIRSNLSPLHSFYQLFTYFLQCNCTKLNSLSKLSNAFPHIFSS